MFFIIVSLCTSDYLCIRWLYCKDIGNMGLDAYFDSGMATKLAVHAQDHPELIDDAFLSLLVVPNSLLFHESDGLKGA